MSKSLCVIVTKKLVGGHFSSSKFSGFEKICASEGYMTFFVEIFLSQIAANFLR